MSRINMLVQLLLLLALSLVNSQEIPIEDKPSTDITIDQIETEETTVLEAQLKCTQGCLSCDSYGCFTCQDGYYVEVNLTCTKCPMKECVTCASNGCLSCPTNYFLYLFQCIPCSQKNCPTCNQSGFCTSCYEGFYLHYTGTCVLCQEHCKSCNSYGCATCKDGYLWDGKNCILKCELPNCQTCDRDGDCVVCQAGYTLKNYKCYKNSNFLTE